jgi:Fe-S cluster biosynthesis and repair protein YggX
MPQRMIHCKKLKKQLPGLDSPPFNNSLGENIYNSISKEAWDLWLEQQTMLINEYRLNLIEKSSVEFLQSELNRFLFEDSSSPPPEYTPVKK